MPNLSTLTVTLSANSARLVAAFNQTQRRARSWSQRITGTLKVAGRAFGILGTAAVGSLSALTQAGISAGDQLAKTSAKLGVLPNQLAGLRFAAEQTGVDIRKLDLGLQRMVRRVSEAAIGTGEAQGAIKELGLSAQDLARLSPDQQFAEIAEAMAQVKNQSDRVRLGFKLFDSEGVALINTLAAGREGLREYTEEAARLGLALGPRQLKNIEAAADAQNRLGRAFSGLGRQLAAVFAPAMRRGADAIANLVARITEAIPKLSAMASAIFGVRREVNELTKTEIRAELTEIFKAIDDQRGIVRNLQNTLRQLPAPDPATEQLLERETEKLNVLLRRSADLQKGFRDLKMEAEGAAGAAVGVVSAVTARSSLEPAKELLAEANVELGLAVANIDKLSARGASIFESTRTPIEQFIARMREARRLNEQGFLPGGDETLRRLREQLLGGIIEPVEQGTGQAKERLSDLSQFGIAAARNIQTAFADKLRNGMEDGFKGIAKSFGDMLKDMAAQVAANRILEAFFGLFKGNKGFLGDIARGFLDKRAAGGMFSGSRPVLVGEKGPELLFPKGRPGYVAPNAQVGGNVVVNIQNPPVPARTRERNVGGTRVIDVVFDPIMQDIAHNGPLAQAIGARFGLTPAFASR